MARNLAVAALTGLLIAGLVGAAATTPVGGQTTTTAVDERTDGRAGTATVSVSGTGEAAAEPDRALVSVSVTATASSSDVAAERLTENASQVRTALAESNRTDGVRTTDYRIFTRQENGTQTYVASQSFEVEVPDIGAVGEVIDAAVAAGATEVNGVTFTLSEERRRELRATAIDRAVGDARNRAEAVAASTGLTLGDVRSVSTDDGGFVSVREATAAAGGGTEIDPGPVTVSSTVRITYNATG